MWDLPRAGTEPVPSALAGGFLTTVPPGKSPCILLNINYTAVFKSISSAPGLSLSVLTSSSTLLTALDLCYVPDLAVLRQVGSYFSDQGLNLRPLHWKADA